MTPRLLLVALLLAAPAAAQAITHDFTVRAAAEGVATIAAGCAGCDWGVSGRQAVVLELSLDGTYSQHLVLNRSQTSEYRVMLGALAAGEHRLSVRRDERLSARDAGNAVVSAVAVRTFTAESEEYARLNAAPFLHARPGTIERFSDLPLLMYVEQHVAHGEGAHAYRYQYTVVFSNEDGGTPADRLMATWGRTTDIEFVFGVTPDRRELIQTEGHTWVDFRGRRRAGHPELWVSTDNNMVDDQGDDGLIRFAPAPVAVRLDGHSREAVMDGAPWTYAVAAAEAAREHRIDPGDRAGSGRIVDPRRYAVVEACADVTNAVVAMDVGVSQAGRAMMWYGTDQADARFTIARGGCFRGGAALPADVDRGAVTAVRLRAYRRSDDATRDSAAAANVVLRSVTGVFTLDSSFEPVFVPGLHWSGELPVATDGTPVAPPVRAQH